MEICDDIINYSSVNIRLGNYGKWIEYDTITYNGIKENGDIKWGKQRFFRCSNCQKVYSVKENYCPNCKSRMNKYLYKRIKLHLDK